MASHLIATSTSLLPEDPLATYLPAGALAATAGKRPGRHPRAKNLKNYDHRNVPTGWPAWFERPMLINMEQSCGLSRPRNDRAVLNFGDFKRHVLVGTPWTTPTWSTFT